jgi:molecular chaperone HtpG
VSDEVVVLTRSARDDAKTFEWRGRTDGTYSLAVLDQEIEPGTEVHLSCKAGSEQYFEPESVRTSAHHYGSLLKFPITFFDGGQSSLINDERPPWEREFFDAQAERAAYMQYGKNLFEMDFFDYVPLHSEAGDVRGIAYVLPIRRVWR